MIRFFYNLVIKPFTGVPYEVKLRYDQVNRTVQKKVLVYIKKHLMLRDPKIMALTDYQLVLGTTEILWEEKLIREGKQVPMVQIIRPEDMMAQPTSDDLNSGHIPYAINKKLIH